MNPLPDVDRFLQEARTAALIHLGLSLGLFDALSTREFDSAAELAASAGTDRGYTERWVDAAIAAGILSSAGALKVLPGAQALLPQGDSIPAARLVQSLYSILLIDHIVPMARRGVRPGFSVIQELEELKQWYGFVSRALAKPIWEKEVQPQLHCMERLRRVPGTIVDYGGGSGWLTKILQQELPAARCVCVVDGPRPTDIETLSVDEFRDGDLMCDVILLNKVAHHLGAALPSTLTLLANRLSPNGALVVWDFNWMADGTTANDFELAFLNLIEHIQNAGYLPTAELLGAIAAAGLDSRSFTVAEGRELVIEARHP